MNFIEEEIESKVEVSPHLQARLEGQKMVVMMFQQQVEKLQQENKNLAASVASVASVTSVASAPPVPPAAPVVSSPEPNQSSEVDKESIMRSSMSITANEVGVIVHEKDEIDL